MKTLLGTEIRYKFRPALQDRKHLIVIFSGFRKIDTYDLDGASSDGLRANMLWIQDNFQDNFTYYMRIGMKDHVELAVHELIESTRIELGLDPSDVTVAGFSKGGSAALFFGIKYNYGAMLAVVPQFEIGSYVKENWPQVHEHMTSDKDHDDTQQLDNILPKLIRNDHRTNRSIYLFSSEADPQHKTQVQPYLADFSKYDNFNYIETDSPIVDGHSIVTRYNVPLIVSILGLLTEKAVPIIGKLANGSKNHKSLLVQPGIDTVREKNEVVQSMTRLEIDGGRLLVEGRAFIRGYEATSYGSIRINLVFESFNTRSFIPLGTVKDSNLSYHFFDTVYCDYTYGSFATIGFKGLNLELIPFGTTKVMLHLRQANMERTINATSNRTQSRWYEHDADLINVVTNTTEVKLTRRSPLGIASAETYFSLDEVRIDESKLYVRGYFIQPGFATPNYGDVVYYIVLSDTDSNEAKYTIPVASDHRSDTNTRVHDDWQDYSKSYFATRKYDGVDISHLAPGDYTISISARYENTVFTKNTQHRLVVRRADSILELPSIFVLGSCVSRDIFNSRIAPNWKKYYSMNNEHYQSSLVSLMAPPVVTEPNSFNDLDPHSREVTRRDFSKQFLDGVISNPPSAILIDLFADARFGVLPVSTSYVTNNAWKLHESEYYKKLDSHKEISMESSEKEFITLFQDAVKRFALLRKEHFPKTLIVINRARAVTTYVTADKVGHFSHSDVEKLNSRWNTLEKILHNVLGGDYVSGMSEYQLGDGSHPWGPGPVHYQPDYYKKLQFEMLEVLGISNVTAEVHVPSNSNPEY